MLEVTRHWGRMHRLALGLGAVALLLIGCFRLTETGFYRTDRSEPTSPATTVERLVRVRLGGRAAKPSAVLSVTSPFRIADVGSGTVLVDQHAPVRGVRAEPAPGGVQLGGELMASSDVVLTPARDASLVLDGETYRGGLRIRRGADGLFFTNLVDVESYLRGVLRGELPRYFHRESFKAQAVAARTYVLYQRRRTPTDRDYDVFDHEGSQMYLGVAGEDSIAVRAVEETCGEVCTWNDGHGDQLFCTYYSSTCGGLTQRVTNVKPNDPEVPPLRGNVACPDCYVAPHFKWGPERLSKAELTKRVVARYPSLARLGTINALRPKATTVDGRITHIELIGDNGQAGTLVGEDFRLSVGGRTLKSTNFNVSADGSNFIFSNGRGFGHGMGLCQWGMETKARRGWDYRRILATYYPDSSIIKLY